MMSGFAEIVCWNCFWMILQNSFFSGGFVFCEGSRKNVRLSGSMFYERLARKMETNTMQRQLRFFWQSVSWESRQKRKLRMSWCDKWTNLLKLSPTASKSRFGGGLGVKCAPRWAEVAPRWRSRSPRWANIGAKRSQEALKNHILASCWEHFARFGQHFEHMLSKKWNAKNGFL